MKLTKQELVERVISIIDRACDVDSGGRMFFVPNDDEDVNEGTDAFAEVVGEIRAEILDFEDATRESEGFFPISQLHRYDIAGRGFDTSKLSDLDMEHFASKMHDAEMEEQYWISIDSIAEEVFKLPRNVKLSTK